MLVVDRAKKGVISLTANQIEYFKSLETRRNNLALAELTRRRDEKSAALGRAQLQEVVRSNQTREAETHRANVAAEGYRQRSLDETIRANITREEETQRSNLAREAEEVRYHDLTDQVNRMSLAERARAAQAQELENQRSHMAQESIQSRSVSATAAHYADQIALGYSQLSEKKQYDQGSLHVQNRREDTNQTAANQRYYELQISDRIANIREGTLAEQIRSNKVHENLTRKQMFLQAYGKATEKVISMYSTGGLGQGKSTPVDSSIYLMPY